MHDATNANVSYVDHTNSAFSLGGLDGSASGSSLASMIRNRIIEYEIIPTMPHFSEEPVQFPDDAIPFEEKNK